MHRPCFAIFSNHATPCFTITVLESPGSDAPRVFLFSLHTRFPFEQYFASGNPIPALDQSIVSLGDQSDPPKL